MITANVLSSDGYLLVSKDKVVNADEKLNTNIGTDGSGAFGFGRILFVIAVGFLVYKAIKKLVE